jgi:ligand-binding sensor domain-containing protein
LPTNSIYCITENKNGEIILGTDNGLTFFNGNNFKTLNVKDGLINPYIVAVTVDKKGVLWFINYGAKLQKYENNMIQNTSVFSEYHTQIIETKDKFFFTLCKTDIPINVTHTAK